MEELNSKDTQSKADTQQIDNSVIEQGHILGDWFIFRDQRHFGPLTSRQVQRFLAKKLISTKHYLWRPGCTGWVKIEAMEAFRPYGVDSIKTITDSEFSKLAKIDEIDKIAKLNKELDFEEGSSDAEIETGLSSFFSGVFDFHSKRKNYPLMVFSIAVLLLVVGAQFIMSQQSKYPYLESVTADVKLRLINISQSVESVVDPKFSLFQKVKNSVEPEYIGATNLPVGSEIKIQITGKPDTLVGSYRFNKTIKKRINSKIFKTEAIREASGKYLSPGQYSVVATCLSCEKLNHVLFEGDFSAGITDQIVYKRELKSFHRETRQKAQIELNELKDLSRSLSKQYRTTVSKYVFYSSKSMEQKWAKFSTRWLGNQNKFVDLFAQMKSQTFMDKLFYLPLYQGYGDIVLKIFELHMLQDSSIQNSTLSGETSSQNISELAQQVSVQLAKIDADIKMMEKNLTSSTGLPSQNRVSRINDVGGKVGKL